MADTGFDLSSATPVQQDSGFDLSSAQPAEFEDDSAIAPLPTRAQEVAGAARQALDPKNSLAYGAGEAGLKFASGTAAFLLKGLRSTWDLATHPAGQKIFDAAHDMQAIDQSMDVKPGSPSGQLFGKAMDIGGGWQGKLSDKAGDWVTEKTGSPGWGAATSWALQAAPVVLGAKYASRSGRVAPGMSAPAAEAAARNHVNNGLGLDWDTLSANVQKKLTALAATGSDLSSLDAPAVARQSRLDKLGIPYTRGDVTRSGAQVTREETLSKAEKAGAPIREVRAGQDEALHASLAKLRSGTGAMAETREGVGTSVQDLALRKKEAVSKANYGKLYDAARATEPDTTVSAQPMADLLSENPEIQHLGFVKSWLSKAGLKVGEDGAIEGSAELKLNQLDDLRKKAVAIARGGGTDGFYAGEAIKAIDKAFEGVPAAAKAWRTARDAYKAHKIEFEDTGAVAKQVGMKSRVDRTTALADTFDRFIAGSADDIRHIQKSLTTGGDVKTQAAGAQAWRDLQGATLDFLKEKAVGKRGIEADTSTEAGKRAFESGKPLEQFNSAFRDAYAELRKDGKIEAIFSPEQVAQLDDIYAAVGDVRTRPPARISGSPTAANAIAMLEDMAHRHLLESIPMVGKPLGWAANWYRQRGKTNREVRQAATTPLDEEAQRATDAARRQRVWSRVFRFGAAPIVGSSEEGGRPSPDQFARGGVVRFAEGGVAIKAAVKKLAESLEEIKARRTLEQQHAKAPVEGQFSTLDKVIESAPDSLTLPEQWQGYLNNRAFKREGVTFPLKKEEMDFTGLNKALQTLKDRQALEPENFQLSTEPKGPTPLEEALGKFHQDLADKGIGHYRDPDEMWNAWIRDTPHPTTGHVLNSTEADLAFQHHQIVQDLKNGAGEEGSAHDPFAANELHQFDLSPRSVTRDNLLAWLRSQRPQVTGDLTTEHASHHGDYAPNNAISDLTGIAGHWDPHVQPAIQQNTGHFSSRPVSWGISSQGTNPAGQTGRVIAEIQSDFHGKAGEKVATPMPENLDWLSAQQANPTLSPEIKEQLPGLEGLRERLLDSGEEPPQGMGSRPRGYGPIDATLADENTTGKVPPLYEGVPLKKIEGYGPFEIRKALARTVNEGGDFLGMASGADQLKKYPRSSIEKGMKTVYDEIYPKQLEKLARQYGIPYQSDAAVGMKPLAAPPRTGRIDLEVPDPPYTAVRQRGNRPFGLGDWARNQQKELQTALDATNPAGEREYTFREQARRNDANRALVNQHASGLISIARKYYTDIDGARNARLIDWDLYHEARTLKNTAHKLVDRMTDWNAKAPGPVTLRKTLNRLEAIHEQVKPLIATHNEQFANPVVPVREAETRPAALLSPEDRERISRIGVPLFSAAGAALGLGSAQDQQPQYARGGIVQRFGEGGVALKSAVKKLAESLEEIKARRELEKTQAKAPTLGQFSVLDKLIESAPDSITRPEQWQGYFNNRSFKREGVNFPLKKEELDFTGTNTLLQKLKGRQGLPPEQLEPPPLTPRQKALKDFKEWMEPNREALGMVGREVNTPMQLYEQAAVVHPMPDWRVQTSNHPLWEPFYRHYQNVDQAADGPTLPPDPFAPAKLAAHNLAPDKVTKQDLLGWLRANRPEIAASTHRTYGDNRAPWLRAENPTFPYREELSVIKDHWDPEVERQIRNNTGHYGRSPLSWSRSTDVTGPSGMGRVINEIQSDVHGKAGNRVATPPPQLREWAENMPDFLPQEMRNRIQESRSLQEHELQTEDNVPAGMGVRRIGYGPLSAITGDTRKPGIIPPVYEGVPLQGLEGYPPFEVRRNFADAANTEANFLGMASGKDQKDIYGDRQGQKWTEAMGKVYGTPETPGFYEKPLKKLADQYGLPYARDHLVGHERPERRRPIRLSEDATPDPAVMAALGEGRGAPATLGDYAAHRLSEAQAKLNAASAELPPEATLRDRMRHASAAETEPGYAAYHAPGNFKVHTENLVNSLHNDITSAEGANLLPPELYQKASELLNEAHMELGKIENYGNSKEWPDTDALKGHIDKLEEIHRLALGKIAEYNEALRNPPQGTPIHRPAVLMDAAARERIRRIGVPLFSAAGAALGINDMTDTDQQGFARGGPVRGYYGGGIAASGDTLTPEQIAQSARPGFFRRVGPQIEADWSYLDKQGQPHLAGSDDSNRATNIKLLEDFGGMPMGLSGLANVLTDGYLAAGLDSDSAIADKAREGLGWSSEHFDKGDAIEKAVRKKHNIPEANSLTEKAEDLLGNVLGQIPTGELTALGLLKRLKLLDAVPGASKLARSIKYAPPATRAALRPAAAVLDYFGPTIKGPLHPSSYLWATGAGLGVEGGMSALQKGEEDASVDPVAARALDDARDKVHLHHLPSFPRLRPMPLSYAEGGAVSAPAGSSLADGMSSLLEMAGRLGKLADKAYPVVSKHLKSPLSPKPKPKAK